MAAGELTNYYGEPPPTPIPLPHSTPWYRKDQVNTYYTYTPCTITYCESSTCFLPRFIKTMAHWALIIIQFFYHGNNYKSCNEKRVLFLNNTLRWDFITLLTTSLIGFYFHLKCSLLLYLNSHTPFFSHSIKSMIQKLAISLKKCAILWP